jgi:hypothetical protein
MMALMHPDIEFQNLSGGEVNATGSGAEAFRQLAQQSKGLFSWRKQTVTKFWTNDAQAIIEVAYEGDLAYDLPNGMKAGETLRLTGQSEFTFRDGKIFRITDVS